MRQQTDLMRQILKNPVAQEIIDYVSPIYGDSYVALWIYEAIGVALSRITTIADQLRYESNPMTTTLLMDYWEDQYGLPRNSGLDMEARRERLLEKIRFRAPCNPERLAKAMERILGVPVEITERVGKNTFQVEILDAVSDFQKMLHALEVLEARKPAHLIYRTHVTSQVDATHLKLAAATAQQEMYSIGVEAIRLNLQTTLMKAMRMGAVVTNREVFGIMAKPVAIEAETDLVHHVELAGGLAAREDYGIPAGPITVDLEADLVHRVEITRET